MSQIRYSLCEVLLSFEHLHDLFHARLRHHQIFKDPFRLRAKFHEHSDFTGFATNNAERLVLPIFHNVKPSDVRYQTGNFAIAFEKHEEKYKNELRKVKRWRSALWKLSNLSGWDSRNCREGELIQDIFQTIWRKLHPYTPTPAINNVSSLPSSSSSLCQRKHDVFLSFRGKDTRLNFLKHLYDALIQQRISTFRDDKDLDKGMDIATQLVQAIEGSKVSVVIVSPNYASSEWCLNELVTILELGKISEDGKKYATLMRGLPQHEEKAHNLEGRCKINKWKGSLQSKEDISNHNNRKPINLSLTVNNNDGEWADSVKTKKIVNLDEITYDELLNQICRFVGINPNQNERSSHHNLRTFTGNKCLCSATGFKNPLQNACDRRMTEVPVLVNYGGEWVNSTYVGGKTKGMVISEDITYQGLVDRVYGVVGVDSHEYKLILKARYESKLPTQPIEITDDDDLAFFIKENLSWDMSSRIPLCATLKRWTFPYGRTESSENNRTGQTKRFETYQGHFNGVTPDPVPYLQQPYCQQRQPWQPYYEHYKPCYQQLQWVMQEHIREYL